MRRFARDRRGAAGHLCVTWAAMRLCAFLQQAACNAVVVQRPGGGALLLLRAYLPRSRSAFALARRTIVACFGADHCWLPLLGRPQLSRMVFMRALGAPYGTAQRRGVAHAVDIASSLRPVLPLCGCRLVAPIVVARRLRSLVRVCSYPLVLA